MASGPSVSFPATDPNTQQIPQPKPPHLPFRRISLPTAPTFLHRQSVISVSSVDSLPEHEEGPRRNGILRSPAGLRTARPLSIEFQKRRDRRRGSSAKPKVPDVAHAVKRRKIIDELYETEKAYVDGLNLIYYHFLVPVIESLDTPEPILTRSTLNATFSNFIDIWNFHRSFFMSLDKSRDSIATLLLSHFPYLSLYNPFITQFSSIISSLTYLVTPPTPARPNPLYNAVFTAFLQAKEADPKCGKLKLRDWLLTIVQRCPRYLLLLKDLINNTSPDDPEQSQLTEAHGLVSKITLGLNASLHTHAQTLALLALQRSTSGLPFQLISPGRTLIKRGPVLQAERNASPRPREFLLFSDCIIWLASTDAAGTSWDWDWSMSGWSSNSGSTNTSGGSNNTSSSPITITRPTPPPLVRSRSKSEAELVRLGSDQLSVSLASASSAGDSSSPSTPISPLSKALLQRRSHHHGSSGTPPPAPPMPKRRSIAGAVGSSEEKWTFKGRADLVDLEVTVGSVLGEERRFEVLSPEGSFVVYASSESEREEWVTSIRQAKAHLLISLNATNPNSTLTSSASTNHIRKSLQALPFHPSDERLASQSAGGDNHKVLTPVTPRKTKGGKKEKVEVRRKVEHWVPAVWIPDGRTSECMRCGKLFGWRRRRHHCRLCGRCVCADCSGRTFFISDASGKSESTKPARACDACYETVFPIVEEPSTEARSATATKQRNDTISSLANFPAWISMPSFPTAKQSTPQALMAIDLNYTPERSFDVEGKHVTAGKADLLMERDGADAHENDREDLQAKAPRAVLRFKPHQKLKSYHQIFRDFQAHGGKTLDDEDEDSGRILEALSGGTAGVGEPDVFGSGRDDEGIEEGVEEHADVEDHYPHLFFTPSSSTGPSPLSSPRKRKEDTARRSKRYSLPALALQTTPVTARSSMIVENEGDISKDDDNASTSTTPSRTRRYSLVLSPGKSAHLSTGRGLSESVCEEEEGEAGIKSLAVDKLSALLGRHAVKD